MQDDGDHFRLQDNNAAADHDLEDNPFGDDLEELDEFPTTGNKQISMENKTVSMQQPASSNHFQQPELQHLPTAELPKMQTEIQFQKPSLISMLPSMDMPEPEQEDDDSQDGEDNPFDEDMDDEENSDKEKKDGQANW